MKARVVSIATAGMILWLAACSSPVVSRIAENPGGFAKLSDQEKTLVKRGEVASGMTKEAVTLAWGRPDRQTNVILEGVPCEKWVYTGYVPVDGYYLETARPGTLTRSQFSGLLLVGDSTTGNYTVDRIRDGYFRGDSLFAWDVAH